MKKRLSEHAKMRGHERFNVPNRLLKEIMMHGYTVHDFEGQFYNYLCSVKAKGPKQTNVKVKDNIMVIYNKRSQRAITTYKVPDRYMPVENYLKKHATKVKKVSNLLWKYINSVEVKSDEK